MAIVGAIVIKGGDIRIQPMIIFIGILDLGGGQATAILNGIFLLLLCFI